MALNRRELLTGLGGVAASAAIGDARALHAAAGVGRVSAQGGFRVREGDHLYQRRVHASDADGVGERLYASREPPRDRRCDAAPSAGAPAVDPKAAFAALINAKPSEISYIPNTSAGENLVVESLGLTRNRRQRRHRRAALRRCARAPDRAPKRQGLDVRVVDAARWPHHLEDLERVVDRKTKLVEISLVSMYNGFQHDLKAVCDLAHAHGAYVYADIIQAAGAVPIDVARAASISRRRRPTSG